MTKRYVSIGSSRNVTVFDDAETYIDPITHLATPLVGIRSDARMQCAPPTDEGDVVTLGSIVNVVANIDNPTELHNARGVPGILLVAYQENAGALDDYTLYVYDLDGPVEDIPYVVIAAPVDPMFPGNERWIAIGGKYSFINQTLKAILKMVINPTINNTAPGIEFVDTTVGAKGLKILVDADKVDFKEIAGASGSLLFLNLLTNLVGIGTSAGLAKLSINGGLHVGGDLDPGNDNVLVDGTFEVVGLTKTTGGVHVGGSSDPGADNLLVDGTIQATGAFGCNSAAPQVPYASGGALSAYATGTFGLDTDAHMKELRDQVVAIRVALVTNGIMS